MPSINITLPHCVISNHFSIPQQSFCIQKGAWTGLVGSSGSGKTTLLKIIGTVLPKSLYTCQNDALIPWMTVEENLMLLLSIGGKITQHGKDFAHILLKEFQLDIYKTVYPHTLSYGMTTRTLLARALFARAEIYLLDEVFNGLDESTKKDVMACTKKLLHGKTVIFVSHNFSEIEKTCGKIYTIDQGIMGNMHT